MVKKNKMLLFMIALLLLSFQLPLLPSVCASDSVVADTNQVLIFLKDVIGLDMESYEITLETCSVNNYSDISFIGYIGYTETSGSYSLLHYDYVNFDNSYLTCSFRFANSTLTSVTLYVDSGAPLYSKPLSSDLAVAAQTFLQRYKAFSKDSEITAMQSMLTNIDVFKNSTKTIGSVKQEVSVAAYATSFNWKQTYNNVEYPGIGVSFSNGTFYNFGDARSIYTIANTSVNISKEQATTMALSKADAYSYKYADEVISNFSIVKDQILAELKTRSRYTVNELYPYWEVLLPLSDVYPGFVSVIRVEIWANDGEVISCQALSYGGPAPSDNPDGTQTPASSSSTNAASDPIENGALPISVSVIAIVVAVILIPITIALSALTKKKRNK